MKSAFQTPKTINEVIMDIDKKRYLIPSIQREFVWNTEQITKLFDSLMKDYPINSFLFWKVPDDKLNKFGFYEFLRDFHEKDNRHNISANLKGVNSNDVTAVLDGQQRLTALYIGLKGTYASKIPYKKKDDSDAYPKKMLYLNILQNADKNTEYLYDFKFLTEKEAKEDSENSKSNNYWFQVGEVLNFTELDDILDYLSQQNINKSESQKFARKTLTKLYDVINKDQTINYYLETSTDLNHVLNIFIRVNSGGTQLGYSDLLLSFITAQWEEKNVREEIINCIDDLNLFGRGFNLNKDWFLKACLVLCDDIEDITFTVENFDQKNMEIIKKQWDKIIDSMKLTLKLVDSFGFSRHNIKSNNALIPIAYYLFKNNNPKNFVESENYKEDRKNIKKWFFSSNVLHAFGGSTDSFLSQIRKIICNNNEKFPIDIIKDKFRGKRGDIIFTEDKLNNLFEEIKKNNSLAVLSMLYPWVNLKNNIEIDHIYPRSFFTNRYLKKNGITESDKIDFYLEKVDSLANLQLLEGIPNKEKSDKDFKTWLYETFPDDIARKDYMRKHYIPENIDLDFSNFKEFVEEREKLLKQALKNYLFF